MIKTVSGFGDTYRDTSVTSVCRKDKKLICYGVSVEGETSSQKCWEFDDLSDLSCPTEVIV